MSIRGIGVRIMMTLAMSWAALLLPACREKDPTPQIIASFNHYQSAALAHDGKKAIEAVSRRTFEYYDTVLDLALHAPIEELNAVPVPDRMLAIKLRHELEPEQAKEMNGAKVFAWCIDQGWMVQEQERDSKLENIQVNGDEATATYVVPDYPMTFPRVFRKEGGSWKNDLVPTFIYGVNEMMKSQSAELADEQNEMIYMGLSLQTKKPLTREVWNPPFPRSSGEEQPKQ